MARTLTLTMAPALLLALALALTSTLALAPHPHPHSSPCQACALPFVLLTIYGWHFAAAALTIFHDMLDRLDGTTPTRTLTPASTPRAHPCPSSSPRRCRRRPAQGVRRSRRRAARLP